jgi:hypothetical protein
VYQRACALGYMYEANHVDTPVTGRCDAPKINSVLISLVIVTNSEGTVGTNGVVIGVRPPSCVVCVVDFVLESTLSNLHRTVTLYSAYRIAYSMRLVAKNPHGDNSTRGHIAARLARVSLVFRSLRAACSKTVENFSAHCTVLGKKTRRCKRTHQPLFFCDGAQEVEAKTPGEEGVCQACRRV